MSRDTSRQRRRGRKSRAKGAAKDSTAVRLPPEMLEAVERFRKLLARKRHRKVTTSEAVRILVAAGLPREEEVLAAGGPIPVGRTAPGLPAGAGRAPSGDRKGDGGAA